MKIGCMDIPCRRTPSGLGRKENPLRGLSEYVRSIGQGTTRPDADVRRPRVGISKFYLTPSILLGVEYPEVV